MTRRGSFLLQGCGKRWEGIASLYAIQTKQNLLHPNPGRSAFPLRDARTKALRKERQKKIALGHKEDDHEEEPTWQQTM